MIIPAIIAKDFEELKLKLLQIDRLVSWAQIDVMDGVFVPPKTWDNPADLENIHAAINLEAHLMVANPESVIDRWLDSPIKRILIHYESTDSEIIVSLLKKITDSGKLCGIALKLETPLWVIDFLIDALLTTRSSALSSLPKGYSLPAIQLMAIAEIGYHGHKFEEKTLERIKILREKYPDVMISVDGGVSLENARQILDAGADNLVIGSVIFKSQDVKKAIRQFNSLAEN